MDAHFFGLRLPLDNDMADAISANFENDRQEFQARESITRGTDFGG
jgi:hypothetical protein